MSNSIEYVQPKIQAIENVKNCLMMNKVTIVEEKEINNGVGYKFTCFQANKFGIVIYFKSGISSKIVFENTPSKIVDLFHNINPEVEDVINQPTVPIYASIKITPKEKREEIKNQILSTFTEVEETQPKSTIDYKLAIKKKNNKFTITQFKNGTLLMQGASSPIFEEVKDIIQAIKPLSIMENTLLYISEQDKTKVEEACKKVSEIFSGLYQNTQERISKDAFEFLYKNDRLTLSSAIGILEMVKQTDLKIPLYNPILYPFAKVFEGFMIRLLIDKCFFTFEEYKDNPDVACIGNALRRKKLKKYIKDKSRNENILDVLKTVWEDLRCHELHSDPAQNDEIINLTDIQQVENRIGQILTAIMDGYRILVQHGYSEAEMLANRTLEKGTKPPNIQYQQTQAKDIPKFDSRIGTDESGKGDYFGPLVIAGVYLDSEHERLLVDIGVQDSKKNSDAKNRELAIQIKRILGQDKYNVVYISPEKYNELYSKMKNLNTLLAWGHARALENILNKISCEYAIADQFSNEEYINKALMEKAKNITLLQTPKAERDIAVAAASILARDTYLQQLKILERKSGIILPKGASINVEDAARKLVSKYGKKELIKYSKIHFKTTKRIVS